MSARELLVNKPHEPGTGTHLSVFQLVPIHWVMVMSLLVIVTGFFLTVRYVSTALDPPTEDFDSAFAATERTQQSVEQIVTRTTPLMGHLSQVELIASRYVHEFDLLQVEPERGTAALESIANDLHVRMGTLNELAEGILAPSSQADFIEIAGVLIDITEDAARTHDPNKIYQLARDSHEMLLELEETLATNRNTIELFTKDVSQKR